MPMSILPSKASFIVIIMAMEKAITLSMSQKSSDLASFSLSSNYFLLVSLNTFVYLLKKKFELLYDFISLLVLVSVNML